MGVRDSIMSRHFFGHARQRRMVVAAAATASVLLAVSAPVAAASPGGGSGGRKPHTPPGGGVTSTSKVSLTTGTNTASGSQSTVSHSHRTVKFPAAKPPTGPDPGINIGN